MKNILKGMLALSMCLSLAACGSSSSKSETDSEYVINNGKLVVGVTDFEPMDYKDSDGNWVGFDADLATAFANSLEVEVEFTGIDWDNKVLELDGKSIDCVWNGMTLTDEVTSSMACSNAYMNNAQVVIVNKDDASKYSTKDACKDLKFAVEAGSAGEEMAKENDFEYTAVKDQATALMEVKSGTCNAAIIDSLMASAMVGEGTNYENLTYTVGLNEEKYGVGFRKESDLADKLNDYLKEAYEDGTITKLADKYGVTAALIEQ